MRRSSVPSGVSSTIDERRSEGLARRAHRPADSRRSTAWLAPPTVIATARAMSWTRHSGVASMTSMAFRLARPTPLVIESAPPSVATLMIGTLFGSPAYRRRGPMLLALSLTALAIIAPWVGELAGWLSPTLDFVPNLQVISPEIQSNPVVTMIALSIYAPLFLLASAAVTLRRARIEESFQTQLHMQAWRMRQLVPAV